MNILFHILHGKWAISREYAASAHALVASIVSEKQDWGEAKALISPVSAYEANATTLTRYSKISELPAGSIAVIEVSGPMTMNDQFCGPMGTRSLANLVSQAADAPNIEGIIMHYTTPGGQAMGTEVFAASIEAAKKKKPTYSLVNMAASAGYWAAAAAEQVWLSGKSSEVGSIGVMCTLYDMRGAYEAEGIKVHHLYSKTSQDKNAGYRQALEGDFSTIEDQLTSLDAIFMSEMKRMRPQINESAMYGATYLAEEAIAVGLADKIGSISELIGYIRMKSNTKSTMNIGKKMSNWLSAKLGLAPDADIDPDLAENKLREAEASNGKLQSDLEQAQQSLSSAQAELASVNQSLALAEQRLAAVEQERDAMKALAQKFGAKPGAIPTDQSLDKRTPDGGGEDPKSKYYNPEAPHNQEAKRFIKR
jgi:protease-4